MVPKRRRPSGTRASPRSTISCAPTAPRSLPSQRMLPPRGRRRPAMDLSSVLLPAPFGPRSATISPAPTVSVTPPSARTSPYDTSRSCTSSMARLSFDAQIGVEHGGIGGDGRGRSLGDLLARAQHDEPPAEIQERPHDMLDDQHALSVHRQRPDERH